ncbi:MAG: histidinol-phosphate aminotransferase family protein [Alistipes sp.]|nr:histidinol-phosphate aminotransferase family protein [Alistipes sp.]
MMYYVNPNLVNLRRIVYQNNRKEYLRLDLNENPGGLPQEFIDKVLSDITPEFVSQYPETLEFETCLADFLGIHNDNLCIVNGSSEGIRHVIEAFSAPGGKIVGVVPSYAMYQVYAEMYGREFIQVQYDDDLTVSADKIINALSEDVDLLILLNPNNPVGNAYTNEEFESILEAAKRYEINLLVDEAYMYFYDNTFIEYAVKNPHVLLTRTFSKLFSLGSLRLGYVVGQPQDVKMISNLCTPHNTNAFAMKFAKEILQTDGMLDELIEKQLTGKRFVIDNLQSNGFVVSAKEGNFIFVKPRHVDADIIVERMKNEKKILIKSYSGIGSLGKCLRVTTGEKQYMERFVDALVEIDQ